MDQLQKLVEISKDFKRDVGRKLLKGLLDYDDIGEFIQILCVEWIPTWKCEDEEDNEEIYDELLEALSNLDMYSLQYDYDSVRNLIDAAQ